MAIGGFTVAARAVQTFAVACCLAISAGASPLDPAPQNNPSIATAGETTYLSLTRSEMRSQMVAGKLDAAARTIKWIRKINLSGTVDASNITYINGDSGQFTYASEMTYADIQAGTTAVFQASTSTAANGTYSMKNGNGDRVDVNLTDQIGFMIDTSNNKAAVINAAVNPLGSNPTNFNDTSRDMVAPQWQVLEP